MLTIENFGYNPDIPVTFTHQGKTYQGVFSEVTGMGAYHWSLNMNGYSRGEMRWVQTIGEPGKPIDLKRPVPYELRFWSQKGDLDYLAEEFQNLIMLWYQ